jgi:hypothetical protein
MVRIDGEWYHCDLTWDDGGLERDRRHFLNSDKKAVALGHRDWYSAYGESCASEKYDAADLAAFTHDLYSGDADHDKTVELYDLLLMTQEGERFCPMCADINNDQFCDNSDAEILRTMLIAAN